MVLTNRVLTPPAIKFRDELRQQNSASICEEIDAREEGVREVTARLIARISCLRRRGGLGAHLHHILLAVLLDLVHRCGSQASAQLVDRSMVAAIIDEPAATLADAAGRRGWGLTYGVPSPDAVERPEVFRFLSDVLVDEALRRGVPLPAVLAGPPGAGKSVAAGLWAADRREHYALTIWLDAASHTQLAEQIPSLMRWLSGSARSAESMAGTDDTFVPEDLAQSFRDALAALPIPWLLVLDGATDHIELGRVAKSVRMARGSGLESCRVM